MATKRYLQKALDNLRQHVPAMVWEAASKQARGYAGGRAFPRTYPKMTANDFQALSDKRLMFTHRRIHKLMGRFAELDEDISDWLEAHRLCVAEMRNRGLRHEKIFAEIPWWLKHTLATRSDVQTMVKASSPDVGDVHVSALPRLKKRKELLFVYQGPDDNSLPAYVKTQSQHNRRVWVSVFNNVYAKTKGTKSDKEAAAFRAANAALLQMRAGA